MVSRTKVVLLYIAAAFCCNVLADGTADIVGAWGVDLALSDDVAQKLQKLFPKKEKYGWFGSGNDGTSGNGRGDGGGSGRHHRRKSDETDSANDDQKENHSWHGNHGAGALRQMLLVSAVKIEKVAGGFSFNYGNDLRRNIQPNPAGHVYSASGKGITTDAIGETLAWWENSTLAVETRTPRGDILDERYALNASHQLSAQYQLRLAGRGDEFNVTRVFVPAPESQMETVTPSHPAK